MVCPVISSLPTHRSWYRKSDEKSIHHGDDERFWIVDEFLIVNRLGARDSDTYVCTVNNSLGHDAQAVELTVTSKF